MTLDDEQNSKDEEEKFWPQWLASFILSLIILNSGMSNGWSSPYLAQLTSPESNSPLKLSDSDTPWIASLLNLGRLIGAFIGVIILSYIGRKNALLSGGFPMAIGWICTINATSVPWLYAARLCLGIGSGIVWTSLTMYLGEIAHPSIRGALISLNVNSNSVGNVLGNIMGSHLPMEIFAYISLVPNILFIALFSMIPESPYHYIQIGDLDKAEQSLRWFRRKTNIKQEMQCMQQYAGNSDMTLIQRLKEFKLPGNRKSILIIISLQFFCIIGLFNIFYNYLEIIIRKAEVKIIKPSTIVSILGICPIVTNFLSAYLVDKFGRRILLLTSAIGVTISLSLLGLHFHLLSLELNFDELWLLPIFSLFFYSVSFAYGLGCVPATLVGELFPQNIKSVAGFISTASSATLNFSTTRAYEPLTNLIGDKFVFWLSAIIVSTSVPFIFFVIPETKGKSFLEIQNTLGRKKEQKSIENSV